MSFAASPNLSSYFPVWIRKEIKSIGLFGEPSILVKAMTEIHLNFAASQSTTNFQSRSTRFVVRFNRCFLESCCAIRYMIIRKGLDYPHVNIRPKWDEMCLSYISWLYAFLFYWWNSHRHEVMGIGCNRFYFPHFSILIEIVKHSNIKSNTFRIEFHIISYKWSHPSTVGEMNFHGHRRWNCSIKTSKYGFHN